MQSPHAPPVPGALHGLVYMSTATRALSRGDMERLVARAQVRNAQYAVTGLLLYSEGSFIQYIEGPAEALDVIYPITCADPLHHHIFEVLREPIETRAFAQWSMEMRATAASGLGVPDPADEVARKLATPARASEAALLLLQAFWNGGLGTRYTAALAV